MEATNPAFSYNHIPISPATPNPCTHPSFGILYRPLREQFAITPSVHLHGLSPTHLAKHNYR